MVAELAKVQAAEAKKFHPGYLSAFPEEFFDRVEARQKVWAPYYTIHKIMAGLLDVSELCGNRSGARDRDEDGRLGEVSSRPADATRRCRPRSAPNTAA